MHHSFIAIILSLSILPSFAGWQPLFNGKDLTGWSGDPRLWRVEDGVIIGETNDSDKKIGANSFLIWKGGEPADFELEYKARVSGNNSGVQYRSRVLNADQWSVSGYQMDLHPKAEYLGMLYEEKGRGIACQRGQRVELAGKPQVTGEFKIHPVDLAEWNTYRIVAKGHVLKHFVNGKPAAEIRDVDSENRAVLGVIALQVHAGPSMKAEFKDLRIKQHDEAVPGASWIWESAKPGKDDRIFFRRELQLPPDVSSATISLSCDNRFHLFINGNDLGEGGEWSHPRNYDVLSLIKQGGRNVIAVESLNEGGSAGLIVRLHVSLKNGRTLQMFSDANWLCSRDSVKGWQDPGFSAASWKPAVVIAKLGDGPWGDIMPPVAGQAAVAEVMNDDYQVAPGFNLERIYQVPSSQGSWVAMTVDGGGNLLCADQRGGIYQVRVPPEADGSAVVEPLDLPLKGAHSLLWHKGVLWVSANEGPTEGGVWRVTDQNGDGVPDSPELVKAINGHGEHGPHSLVEAPDGNSIYIIAGNHTDLPEMDRSLVPRVWQEDQLLPRRPDARGHAQNRMAPGGWIARFDLDGKNWELFSIGYRNPFDMAFNEHGDLFTYDSDMEWDLGMPWYRPTRVCQVTPGSEFGWRNGTGKWPDSYEDSMPSQLDIGPGSPTGLVSGKGAKFPAKYQRAIFGLDWTFATLYAFHLVPDGSGYQAEREEILSGKGLPLTDAVVGADGAMYFLTGGRRADSALWRITYVGEESTDPIIYHSKNLALMDAGPASIALGGSDRVQRFSARTALENAGPGALLTLLADPASNPWQVIGAAIGLARTGTAAQMPEIFNSLDRLDWAALDTRQRINWLRAAGLVFARHGVPGDATRQQVLAKIDSSFPAADAMLNRELCRMLSYLQAPGVVARTLTLMDNAGPTPAPDWLALAERNARYGETVKKMIANLPPAQVIHYVYCLRVVKGPWHVDERKRFFAWLSKLSGNTGGASYDGFINDLRRETIASSTPEERVWLEKLDARPPANPFADLPPIKGPGRNWSIDEIMKVGNDGLIEGSRERGGEIFKASLCAACHRFGSEGGSAGPDLTSLAGRFTIRDIAEAVVDPGKVISDQYNFEIITRNDGTEMTGKVIEKTAAKWVVATNPFDLNQVVEISASDIKGSKASPVSPMPPGLLNRLNPQELKDLLVYLQGH